MMMMLLLLLLYCSFCLFGNRRAAEIIRKHEMRLRAVGALEAASDVPPIPKFDEGAKLIVS